MQITGKIEVIGETVTIPSKNGGQPFYRRELVLDCTRYNPDTGEPWENHPKLEFSGGKCSLLDTYQVGQRVTVDFSLRGTKYQDTQTGETKYFTSVSGYGIALAETAQTQTQEAPQGPAPQAPAQQGQASQGYATQEDKDDLPF